MEINKQLFEDVLSGKLKGTFVLRDGKKIESKCLRKNYSSKFCYCFTNEPHPFTCNGYTRIQNIPDEDDVIDFIVDGIDPEMYLYNEKDVQFVEHFIKGNHMKENELTIEIPVGYEIDKEKSTFEKIIFKKKDTKPRSWKEYLELNAGFDGAGIDWNMSGGVQTTGLHHRGKAIVPTYLAQPFIAMMQLMSLRQAWVGDWKPNWANSNETKYCLAQSENIIRVYEFCTANRTLSFPTEKIAIDFMDCFKDLLKIAKPLI